MIFLWTLFIVVAIVLVVSLMACITMIYASVTVSVDEYNGAALAYGAFTLMAVLAEAAIAQRIWG